MNVAIIGGGAAGFFAAINLKKLSPQLDVTIYEDSNNPLAKVRASGGGRCNLTNTFEGGESLSKLYPRGEKVMRNCFKVFNHQDAFRWFEDNGVRLTVQSDNCVFPQSQKSSEIIETFYELAESLGVKIKVRHRVDYIKKLGDRFYISINGGDGEVVSDFVVATTGGSPRKEGLLIYEDLPVTFTEPMPSLFSFNINNNPITELTGAVVENSVVTLKGTKLSGSGALLITHWGVSGPAVLKLSSYGAKKLHESDYKANILINWVGGAKQEEVLLNIKQIIASNSRKLALSVHPYDLTSRVWAHILTRADISHERRLAELGSKGINRIVATLTSDEYTVDGRSLNKEEFVTCGGVALSSINPSTLEARECRNLYFAGEVLDIDAITGGFNLQAAWSCGFVVAHSISQKLSSL